MKNQGDGEHRTLKQENVQADTKDGTAEKTREVARTL